MKCRHGVKQDACAFCKADKRLGREYNVDDAFHRVDEYGRLNGPQPQIGMGEVEYTHGVMTFMDDGNGNVYDESQVDYDDQSSFDF